MTIRRSFSPTQRLKIFVAADGICHICEQKIGNKEWDVEHRIPLALGGKDDASNWSPAHRSCHAPKTKEDVARITKAKRQQAKHVGIAKTHNPMPGSKASRWKRRMDGTVERR